MSAAIDVVDLAKTFPRRGQAPLRAVDGLAFTVAQGTIYYGARLNWDDIQLRRTYTGLRAYERTKLANILFTVELNARLGEHTSVRAFAADPGLVKTDIGAKNTPSFARWAWNVRRSAGIQPEDAARGVVFLATEASIQESNDPYWRHGTPRRANANALDQHAATRLWQLSAQMCGV